MCATLIHKLPTVAILWLIFCPRLAVGQPAWTAHEQSLQILQDAESRFVPPDPSWFSTTQQALAAETAKVQDALESYGQQYADAWKNHLRWPLLLQNLGDLEEVNPEQLALVRRWMFSNREGLEYPFFAELRTTTEAHLDAVLTFSEPDLERAYREQLAVARRQIQALSSEPNDANAAALGRTLGWMQRSRQLEEEVAQVRRLISWPNAQILVSKEVIDRAIALLAKDVEQSLPVTDRVPVANGGLFGQERMANVRGIAHTHGKIGLDLLSNADFAKLMLVYQGEIESHCRAFVGPVTVAMQTMGPVHAITPIQLSLQGVTVAPTEVDPQVITQITGVSAEREFIRRVGQRRATEPEAWQQMNWRAKQKAGELLKDEMQQRVEFVLEEIRAEIAKSQESLANFQEVLAPVVREGADPRWAGIESTPEAVLINGLSQRREQLAAPNPCPEEAGVSDVQLRMHVSFFNNMAETIMAGKTFTDRYFMNYGRVIQPQLPPPLMVHSRSTRWGIVAAKPRPLEISIPEPYRFRMELRMQQVNIGEQSYTGTTIAIVHYDLVENSFGEFMLQRDGDVQLESAMSQDAEEFLLDKLNAFFAPVLDGSGVALPEGGTLGRLRGLQPQGVYADRDWLAIGIGVPTELMEDLLPVPGDE